MKTLLQIVQQFCTVTGLSVPQNVVSSTDTSVTQILGLLNEGINELVPKYKWPQLQYEANFTSTAVESQGLLDTIAPGFKSLIPNTFWSVSNRLPSNGSISPQDTQVLKIWGRPSALINFREVNGELHFIPAGTAGLAYRFEYNSQYCVKSAAGVPKQYFTADDDVPVLPDILHALDLRWRWKAEKELAYAEHFSSFERTCKQAFVDAASPSLARMRNGNTNAMPGIVVPLGSWDR